MAAEEVVAAAVGGLGFSLTRAQARALDEVLADMGPGSAHTMYRWGGGKVVNTSPN